MNELIRARKAFLRGDASLHLKLLPLFIPLLLFFVVLSQEMGSYFVVKHSDHPSLPVLTWELNVHFTLSSLGVVSDTRRGHLVLLEVDGDPLFNSEVVEVVLDVLMSFLLV